MRMLRPAALALSLAWAAPALGQPDEPAAGTPCAAITCDCETIEAGLLNRAWRADCRACETALVEACLEVYAPALSAWAAMTDGGYCAQRCSVTGDNPYPPAPDATGSDSGAAGLPQPFPLHLRCPFGAMPVTEERDGLTWYGCRTDDGTPVGPWTALDGQGNPVEEVFYDADGNALHRRSS
ncbi:MAG: hypothetical protein R3F55_07805 [Alphaproteobacteria bacterium]